MSDTRTHAFCAAVGAILGGTIVYYFSPCPTPTPGAASSTNLSTEKKMQNLRNVDVFVLDNSLRETTVASLYGHTIEGKYRILRSIRKAGMKNLVVGSFGPTQRVDEGFIASLSDRNELRDDEQYYAFSEFKDSNAPWFEGARKVVTKEEGGNATGQAAVPYGLQVCKKLGIHNVLLELDLVNLWDEGICVQQICKEMCARIQWCQKELHPTSKVFFNFRDFQISWSTNPNRVLAIIQFLALLPSQSRPQGIMYEDQNGSWMPSIMQDATYCMRQAMTDNGWEEGHLLIHVHKGYGMSDAIQTTAMAAGATGIWCGVSANGAMTGHASSIVTLTNLARLGNQHVRQRFNFMELRKAAITIHQVCSKEECPPYMTEIYGRGALDLVWGGGLMANKWSNQQPWSHSTDEPFELQELLGIKPRVRITTMAGPTMFLSKLTEIFGDALPDAKSAAAAAAAAAEVAHTQKNSLRSTTLMKNKLWPQVNLGREVAAVAAAAEDHMGHLMQAMLHEDLRRDGKRQNYNEPLSLFELYKRAYEQGRQNGSISIEEHERTGHYIPAMQKLANEASSDLDQHPLILEITKNFHNRHKNSLSLSWNFQDFYPGWLEPHTHDMSIAKKLFNVLDTDGSGTIDFIELVIACKWVLREFENDVHTIQCLVQKVVDEWLVPEALIHELCVVTPLPSDHESFRSQLDKDARVGVDNILIVTARTLRSVVLQNQNKTVLVAFIVPTCPHCQELLPELRAVAAATRNDPSVVIATMDIVQNTIPTDFEVPTVPTLYFKEAGGFALRYRGLRDSRTLLTLFQ